MENKLKVGKVKPKNSSYIYTLYAYFSEKGKFLYFKYDNIITCYVDDILEFASIFNCDKEQLYKLEQLI
ncbi:MAG: hypothetical protein IKC11_05760 [Clostridia bacterium]|nr:hypothetical protein [Clostridia bacterium]